MAATMKKITDFVNKYKFPALILLLGLFLILLPTSAPKEEPQTPEQEELKPDLSAQQEQILSRIQGVGDVKVLLTVYQGEVTVYQVDVSGDHKDTVIITDANRNQVGLIQQINPPQYLGAVIVCQGGDSAAVRLDIVEAVSDVTGLSADRITVLKMK